MTGIEIIMQSLGWLGMILVLFGMLQKDRENREIFLGTGAGFLAIMAVWPQLQPVFFTLELAMCIVAFISIKPHRQLITLPIIFLASLIGSYFAIRASFGPDTWLAVAGLVGIAIAYSESPEREGGHQSLWFIIGSLGMIGYSSFGVLAGVWQAWPFLILNIAALFIAGRQILRVRKRNKKKEA